MLNRYRLGALACSLMAFAGPDAWAGSGGAVAPGTPQVNAISCASPTACRARKTVVRGQGLVIRGPKANAIRRVVFAGRPGRRDDVGARVKPTSRTSASAAVPAKARTGPLQIQSSNRVAVVRVPRVVVLPAPKVDPLDIAPGSAFYYGGRRKATYSFTVTRASNVRLELVNEDTQAVVRGWDVAATPGAPTRVSWDGTSPTGVSAVGRYRFRLAGGAATPAPGSNDAFFFGDHLFPIRGRHDLGQSPTNGFGGGGRRPHSGQDMFARCATKLAAARGGTVEHAGYQAAAGNYLVIDGDGTGQDYVYMHMRKPALVNTGDRVFTGQSVGEVGETGRASGCHLHFELWTAPGWFTGGSAIDPLPSLRAWDAYS